MPIDILIPTFNEAANLPQAIASVTGWVHEIFVLDSGSTDETVSIARSLGATVVAHPWEGYSRQKNWALDNLPFTSPWIFILDADESVTPQLKEELVRVAGADPASVPTAGFYVNRLFLFMGRPIRHCGYFPSWNLRFFKRGSARYEDRSIHEHMILQGPEGYLRGLLRHEDHRGLEYYIAKHNRYSTLEAELIFTTGKPGPDDQRHLRPRFFGNALERRRFLRQRIYPLLPGKWIVRFLYMYVFQRGFMDGLTGFRFCALIATHEFFTYLKVLELHHLSRTNPDGYRATANSQIVMGAQLMPPPPPESPSPLTPGQRYSDGPDNPDRPAPQRQSSTWTYSEKVKRVAWMAIRATLFRWSFHNWYGPRAAMLRFFGARLGKNVHIRPTASIEIPWNLQIGEGTVVGDFAILYSLGQITIGRGVTISQYAHLCAGTHDHTTRKFTLIRSPIQIGDEVWIAADAFIGPGVTIGPRTLVAARASAFRDVPADVIVGGSPAQIIGPRVLHD